MEAGRQQRSQPPPRSRLSCCLHSLSTQLPRLPPPRSPCLPPAFFVPPLPGLTPPCDRLVSVLCCVYHCCVFASIACTPCRPSIRSCSFLSLSVMSALSGSSRRALSAAASSSARRLHTQQPLSATAAPGAAGSPSAGAGYGAHAAGEQHEEHVSAAAALATPHAASRQANTALPHTRSLLARCCVLSLRLTSCSTLRTASWLPSPYWPSVCSARPVPSEAPSRISRRRAASGSRRRARTSEPRGQGQRTQREEVNSGREGAVARGGASERAGESGLD